MPECGGVRTFTVFARSMEQRVRRPQNTDRNSLADLSEDRREATHLGAIDRRSKAPRAVRSR